MPFGKFNPAYLQFFVGAVLTCLVGLGAFILTDVQVDLILSAVGAGLVLFGVTSVSTAGAVAKTVNTAFVEGLNTPTPNTTSTVDQSY
jgi:hypothetical protein